MSRNFTIYTGLKGALLFELVLIGFKGYLKMNNKDWYLPRRGKYWLIISLFDKHGVYKVYFKRGHYKNYCVLKKGTEEVFQTDSFETINKYFKL